MVEEIAHAAVELDEVVGRRLDPLPVLRRSLVLRPEPRPDAIVAGTGQGGVGLAQRQRQELLRPDGHTDAAAIVLGLDEVREL
jgi:hypothetical protein